MHIERLELDFHLAGCRSLKEKRRRVGRIRDKFGSRTNLAVCEADAQDTHQVSRWVIVAVGESGRVVEQTLADVERWLATSIDAVITRMERGVVS